VPSFWPALERASGSRPRANHPADPKLLSLFQLDRPPFWMVQWGVWRGGEGGPFLQSPLIHYILLISRNKNFTGLYFQYNSFNKQNKQNKYIPPFSVYSYESKNSTKKYPGAFFYLKVF